MTHPVRKRSPEAEALNEHCALIDALLGGTKAMRAAGEQYLPKWPAEDHEAHKMRLAVATLFPAYQRTIEVLGAKPFSKPVTLGKDVPTKLQPWLEDVDRQGRNLHAFLAEVGQEALGYGFSGILVDYPPTQDKDGKALYVTKADEEAAAVRPYFVQIHPKNILGWLTDKDGLKQLRLLETATEDDGDFATKEVEQVRVLTRGAWATWRKVEGGIKQDDWQLHDSGVTTIKGIPFVPVYGNRLGFMRARPALLELAYANVEHWQSKSDQQNILHVARVPILFGKGLDADTSVTVGTGTMIKSDRPDADLKFVEHSGAAIDAGRMSILDLEDRMRQAGAELLVIKPGNVTETQTLADNEQGACALQKVAENIEDSGDQALQFMAEWVGEAQGGHITVFKDFGAATLAEASAELLLKVNQAGKLSNESLYGELQRRGIIRPDAVWADEQERIDAQGLAPGTMVDPLPEPKPKPKADPEAP